MGSLLYLAEMTSCPPKFVLSLSSGPLSLGEASSILVNLPTKHKPKHLLTAVVHVIYCGLFRAIYLPSLTELGVGKRVQGQFLMAAVGPHIPAQPLHPAAQWGPVIISQHPYVPTNASPSALGEDHKVKVETRGARSLSP